MSGLERFLDCHWLTIFSTWVCHHQTMCCVHSWSRIDVDLWPQGKIYRQLSCLHVRPLTSDSFDIGLPYLAHGSITLRGCVKYIHDPDMTLNYDLKVQYIGFMTDLCSGLSFYVLDIGILCLARECNTMVLCAAYNIKILYFQHEFESVKSSLLFDIGIPNFVIWVHYHETTCCVHSWP